MELRKINLNDPLMKALKAVNSISGNAVTEDDLKRQRLNMEIAGRLATPQGGVETEAFSINEMKCEWVRPELAHNPKFVILYAHGGGYITGGLSYARILAAKMALATGFTVLSFDYRLAPEHPYPAALEDAKVVWDELLRRGYGSDRIILAGDSAGGNLVLCLTQKLLQESSIRPRALLLFSPWTDMTAESASYEKYQAKDPILTRAYIEGVRAAFLEKGSDPSDARFSPLYGEFSNFPPTYIQVGKNEILLDDSVKLQKKIQKAGGQAELDIEKDGWHVYQQMPLPMANRAMRRLANYVSNEIYRY